MNPELWTQATALFERASELDASGRAAFLEESCGDDVELRRLVERMLAADERTDHLLDRGHAGVGDLLATIDDTPARLGPYRVTREVGRGGMGVVYLGERADGRFDRSVALKVVHGDLVSRRVVERFESEARILAGLEHPHIARLYDAGVDQGRPYLVMEYVEGERIDRYCDVRRLGLRQRIALFRDVCGAVQYAHQNLVIHRDLKPSNVLVTEEGSVRLLDFGIARLTRDADGSERTLTGVGAFTPEYASPEQIRGSELTTGSDVYTLGLVLYELLTGRRPFESAPGDLAALGERSTREPASPSAVVTRPHDRIARDGTTETIDPVTLGAQRDSTPGHLRRILRGDLDRIVLKALRSDPAERYASAEALSEDLRRYLAGQPVSARPDSLAYRASTFVRRHRVGVAVGALVATALVGATAVAARQAAIAREERDSAARAFSFLEDLITSPDPLRGAGVAADSVRMVDFIDLAAERIDAELTDEPEARAEMLTLLGTVYLNLGRSEQAIRVMESAVEANRAAFGPSTELATALGRLGFAEDQHGDRERGEALIREALDMQRAASDEGSLETANWQEYLGRSLMDSRRLDEAEPYLTAAWETRVTLVGPADPAVAASLNAIGALRSLRGDQEGAAAAVEGVLRIYEANGLSSNPDYAITQSNLSLMYDRLGRLEDAERAATDALAGLEATLGREHFLTAATQARLAGLRGRLERPAEADSLYRTALATLERAAAQNLALAVELGNYASFLLGQRRLGEAEVTARRGMEASARIVGEDHPIYAGALVRVGDALRDQGQADTAVAFHERAYDILVRTLGPQHPQAQDGALSLARSWLGGGRGPEAEALLLTTLEAVTSARGAEDRLAGLLRETLVELLVGQGRDAEAEPYRAGPG